MCWTIRTRNATWRRRIPTWSLVWLDVACNRVPAAIIYRMDADGGNIRCLSANTISEDRPAVLPDGRIVYAWCRAKDGSPAAAFRNTNDPDYRAILQAVQAAKVRQDQYGRPDIRGFRPGDYYVRWMKRFGILPESFDPAKDPIDPYETDRAYWRSLWYHPPAAEIAPPSEQAGK